jgi:hypothetical protein
LTAARDVSSALERAVCVRVQDGNVALRLPAMRALALGRRIAVYCGTRRIALVQGPIGVPPRRLASAEPHGVEHCDDLLVRARQSVWLERMFLQLVREASAFPTDVAFLAEDRRESEHRAVCIVLSFADDAKPLTLSFELEPGVEGDSESDGASTTNARKRRFDDAGGDDDNNDASNDSSLVALASILDNTLSRLCHGVQRQHCRQLARWHAESSAPLSAEDEDTRVAQWLASDDESDTTPKALPVAFAAGGRRLRAKFATYFANEEETIGDDVPVSLVKAVRLLYAQCRSEAVVRSAFSRLQELVFGDALLCEWQSGASPFESKCIVSLQGVVLDVLELIDGKLQALNQSVPRTLVGTVQKLRFVLHHNSSAFERWLQERSAAEKQQLASRIGAASLDAILAVVDIR